jgi:vesicle coat complex subunit
MGRYYDQAGAESCGRARVHQRGAAMDILKNNFEDSTLRYLQESILNYLLDNVALERNEVVKKIEYELNDFSFFIAPSYKALEGFLFQIAEDLELPSKGNEELVGSYYFDESKIDQQIDNLLTELSDKTTKTTLQNHEISEIKERIKEMKGFLKNYRHTPAHFKGKPIDTYEKAIRTLRQIWGNIDNLTQLLLEYKLIKLE